MRVSVVVPTYNRADLLPPTLDAILGQTAPADEVIVVDDGSTDGTAAALAAYAPRVQAVRIENSGDLVARNAGLRRASGDLVAFCDSDDLWEPGFLAAMRELWRIEPRLTAAYSNFALVRNGAREAGDKFADAPEGWWDALREAAPGLALFNGSIVDRLIRFQPFFPSCMAVSRSAFLALGGWDEGVSRMIGCDFATALRVAEHPPIGIVRRPLVGIRKHAGNISADAQAMNLGDARVLEHVLATRASLTGWAPLIQASAAERRRQALETAFARGDFAGVAAIYPLLPPSARSARVRVKRTVAGLPPGLRAACLRVVGPGHRP